MLQSPSQRWYVLLALAGALTTSGAPAQTRDGGVRSDAGSSTSGSNVPQDPLPGDETANPLPAPPARPEMNGGARGRYRDGINLADRGDLPGAKAAFEAALNADARAFEAAYNAGIIAERMGDDAGADGFYGRALGIQPDYELAIAAKGRLLIRQRRNAEAISLAQSAARQFPGNLDLRAEFARLLVLVGRYDDAIEEGRQIIRFNDRKPMVYLAIAEAFHGKGLDDQAADVVDRLVVGSGSEADPRGSGKDNPQVHYFRGLLRLKVREIARAIASFRRAVELDPQFAEAQNNLGVYLFQAGNLDEAIEHFRAALKVVPNWGKAHLNLGDALRAKRQYADAERELQAALQKDNSLIEVHYDLGKLYYAWGRSLNTDSGAQQIPNLRDRLTKYQQSQASFTRYKDGLGANYQSSQFRSDNDEMLTRLTRLISRTQSALNAAVEEANQPQTESDGGT